MKNPPNKDIFNNPFNPERNFEQLFEEITDLLQFAIENVDHPIKREPPKDLLSTLDQLEKDVQTFCERNDRFIALSIDKGEARKDTAHLTKNEQRLLQRAEKLSEEAQEKIKLLENQAAAMNKKSKNISDAQERRKHFKRIARQGRNV